MLGYIQNLQNVGKTTKDCRSENRCTWKM